jgi:hypothetical protein
MPTAYPDTTTHPRRTSLSATAAASARPSREARREPTTARLGLSSRLRSPAACSGRAPGTETVCGEKGSGWVATDCAFISMNRVIRMRMTFDNMRLIACGDCRRDSTVHSSPTRPGSAAGGFAALVAAVPDLARVSERTRAARGARCPTAKRDVPDHDAQEAVAAGPPLLPSFATGGAFRSSGRHCARGDRGPCLSVRSVPGPTEEVIAWTRTPRRPCLRF